MVFSFKHCRLIFREEENISEIETMPVCELLTFLGRTEIFLSH